MLMGSKSESAVFPLVARIVQTPNAALNASNSEGADFLIYVLGPEKDLDVKMSSGFGSVNIPIFVLHASCGEAKVSMGASKFLNSGASGLVLSLEDLKLFSDDGLSQMFDNACATDKKSQDEHKSSSKLKSLDMENDIHEKTTVSGFVKLEDRAKQLIEKERSLLLEAIDVMQKATPLMGELSLLIDAVSQIDEPFLLAIVVIIHCFSIPWSVKSWVNMPFILSKDPFLVLISPQPYPLSRVSSTLGNQLLLMHFLEKRYLIEGVVPTTNEITFLFYSKSDSEEQQRHERHPDGQCICYLPALILKEMNIVDTPGTNVILPRQQRLTEEFVPLQILLLFVFSADKPLTESEVAFLRYIQQWKKKVVFVLNTSDIYRNSSEENTWKLLNTDDKILYPISARSALEAKLSASSDTGTIGMERIMLTLETPIVIAERLLSACETLVNQDCQYAKQDLTSATEIIDSVKEYATEMENESISWRRKMMSLIDVTKSHVLDLIDSTLQLSNLDLVASSIFRGEKTDTMPATSKIQNDIIGPALTDAQFLGTFGGVGAAGLSASHLTSVLPTTLEDLLVLGLCTAEGHRSNLTFSDSSPPESELEWLLAHFLLTLVFSNFDFPARRQAIDQVNRIADGLAREVDEAMQKDLMETVRNLENYVKTIGNPCQDAAQKRPDKLLDLQELSNVDKKT
ncbi:hypothetical protein DKX38_002173 [Salix brachista]|uniref:Dynamin N-terminal domain-containing protein n=1 Tax=Salix brachista TaxID=2182728 RepID=A0A5N5NLB2_9ROSI|nr:hypothetical protein DKX38_002173 [Salix brachista]